MEAHIYKDFKNAILLAIPEPPGLPIVYVTAHNINLMIWDRVGHLGFAVLQGS